MDRQVKVTQLVDFLLSSNLWVYDPRDCVLPASLSLPQWQSLTNQQQTHKLVRPHSCITRRILSERQTWWQQSKCLLLFSLPAAAGLICNSSRCQTPLLSSEKKTTRVVSVWRSKETWAAQITAGQQSMGPRNVFSNWCKCHKFRYIYIFIFPFVVVPESVWKKSHLSAWWHWHSIAGRPSESLLAAHKQTHKQIPSWAFLPARDLPVYDLTQRDAK